MPAFTSSLNDQVFRARTVHPHASERFQHWWQNFGADPLDPGGEMAGLVVKAIFDPKSPIQAFDTPADGLDEVSFRNWYRLPQ